MFFQYKPEELNVGAKILSTVLFSILMVGAVDIFIEWYRTFLIKRGVSTQLINWDRKSLQQHIFSLLFLSIVFIG